jgi:hypothetical protein
MSRATTSRPDAAAWTASEAGGQADLASAGETSQHRTDRRVREGPEPGLEAGLFAGGDDAVVVGGCELSREQQERLVAELAERDRPGVGEAITVIDRGNVGGGLADRRADFWCSSAAAVRTFA